MYNHLKRAPDPKTVTRRVYSYGETVKTYRGAVEHGDMLGPNHARQVQEWERDFGGFYGGTSEEMLERLNKGWLPPVEDGQDAQTIISSFQGTSPAWKFTDDEGDYEHDLFLAGEPEFFLDKPPTPGKPGITIEVSIGFNCSTSAATVGDYGRWVAAAIRSIGSAGFDVALNVSGRFHSLYPEMGEGEKVTNTVVVVKRFGETLLPQDFLVMFSETGYRHLFFSAMHIPERDGIRISGCIGYPMQDQDWAVGYDPDTRVLHVTCPASGYTFPREEMDRMFMEAAEGF